MSDATGAAVAAVDLGTNTTRLLVQRGGHDLARLAVVTGLGRGTDRSGRLSPEGIERTTAALHVFRGVLDEHGVAPDGLRVVATSAARDAANRADLVEAVEGVLGVAPDIITGPDEARLTFAGAVAALDVEAPACVIDIGGGSTEFGVGAASAAAVVSIDVGSVRLTEGYLTSDPPQPDELANALGVVHDHLDDALRAVPAIEEAVTLIGVAGTITTVAAVELGLAEYDRSVVHGFVLTRDAVEDVFRTLATEPLRARVHNPGLPPERADVIVGGCCVLVAILRRLERPALVVSDSDLLDGITAGLRAR